MLYPFGMLVRAARAQALRSKLRFLVMDCYSHGEAGGKMMKSGPGAEECGAVCGEAPERKVRTTWAGQGLYYLGG